MTNLEAATKILDRIKTFGPDSQINHDTLVFLLEHHLRSVSGNRFSDYKWYEIITVFGKVVLLAALVGIALALVAGIPTFAIMWLTDYQG